MVKHTKRKSVNVPLETDNISSSIIQLVHDAIIVVDEDQNIILFNQGAEQTFGYKASEVIGQRLDMLLPPQVSDFHVAYVRSFAKDPETACLMGERKDVSGRRKNGTIFPAEASIAKVSSGGKIFFTAILRDITERKIVEQALRESEKKQSILLNSVDEIIYQVNYPEGSSVNGIVEFVSEQTQEILGYRPIDFITDPNRWFSLIHPDDIPTVQTQTTSIMKSGQPCLRSYRLKDINGDYHWMEDHTSPERDKTGRVVRIFGVARDISKRKQAEEALVESEERFRTLIENSADAITLISPEGVIVYDSPAAPGLLGYAPDEWIGRNVFEAVHPDDRVETVAAFQSTLDEPGRKASHLFRVQHKNGSWRWLEATATNLLDEPAVRAIVVNYGDITERRRAQTASNLMQATALAIAESPDFNSALDSALRTLCEATGWKYAEAWIPRDDKSALELGPVWHGRGKQVEKFRRASQEFIFHPGEGLPGRVWARKAPEWIPDVSVNGDLFRRAPQALEAGLKAGMGVPIIGNGQVLVVAFFMFESRPEDRAMMETAMAVGNQLGTMLLRKRAEEENKRKTEDLLLIQSLNDAANRGDTLPHIFELLKEETAKIFSSRGTAFYRISEDGERLEIAVLNLPSELVNRIEKMIGMKLPKLGVPLREGGLYREILLSGKPRLLNDSESIQRLMSEFTDNPALKKMVGAIYSLLGDHSVISAPMVSNGQPIGLLEVSRNEPFTEADLNRLAIIGGEVTAILQRKRTEENLRHSEEKYRKLTETLPIGIAVTTPKGKVIEANPALVKMSGHDSKEEFLQAPAVIHYLNPEDRSRYVAQLLERGAVSGFEIPLLRKDGSVFWASASSVAQKHPDGSITLVHSVEDISERKRAEAETQLLLTLTKAVAEAESLDAALTLAMSLVCRSTGWDFGEVWIPSYDGTHLELGSPYYGMESFQGLSKGFEFAPGIGLPGQVWASGKPIWIPDVTVDANFSRAALAVAAGVKAAVGIPILAGDTVVAVINFFLREARQEDERMVALISAVAAQLGTTFQRKQSEDALRESEAVLSSAQEVGHIGSWVLDLQCNATTWSVEAYRIYGVSPGTPPTYETFLACIHPEDREYVGRSWREALVGAPYDIEHRIVVGEEVKWVHERAELQFDADGAPLNGIGTVQDITERKQAEQKILKLNAELEQRVAERTADLNRANIELERSVRVKDEFLANMSHELRTPLAAILGLSESLEEQIVGQLNEKQQNYVHTIRESGHHLLTLINDILDLAKIEAGQITLDFSEVDIRLLCESSLRMVKELAQKKHQVIGLEMDDGLGLIWADNRRLKQMIINLLSNAVKFTPEGGRIGLEIHAHQEENKVTITVWDSGIGITENDQTLLFQPFVQLDSSLARESTGTGLGLALVAQMARLHGGSVSVASEPGKGSRFTILLPWKPALATNTTYMRKVTGKLRAIKPGENRPTILLVEDTNEVIMVVRDYLEYAGYKVEAARNGMDGIAQAKKVRPDLILMDVQMPGMDGLEAAQRLRSEPEFEHTPIIALTALVMQGDRERCFAAGMDEYISKPVNLQAMLKMIQNFLSVNEGNNL